jgi:hypothetical protein
MATLTFRVRKELTWNGKVYQTGELVQIEEGHPRLRALIEQSHHLEYSSSATPKVTVNVNT